MKRGKYIIIDGIEAIGKGYLTTETKKFLRERGINLQGVIEPGGTHLGNMERALIKEPIRSYTALKEAFQKIRGYNFEEIDEHRLTLGRDPKAELYEFLVSRSCSASEIVLPALKRGNWIVTDRGWTTSFAYQGFGRFNGEKQALRIITENHRWILQDAFPGDRIYIIDITTEESIRRMQADLAGRTSSDLMDNQSIEFYERNRKGYRAMKKRYPKQVKIINGMRTPEEIFADIKKDLEGLLKAGGRI